MLLDSGEGSVGFSGAGRACGKRLRPGRALLVQRRRRRRRAARGRRRPASRPAARRAKAGEGVRIGGRGRYRGTLVARNEGGSLQVINALGAEGYVKGVVANEVPSSWPAAGAARPGGGRALLRRSRPSAAARSTTTTTPAARSTAASRRRPGRPTARSRRPRGEVVSYRGEPAITYYFSTSGGQTESSEFGFSGGSRIPYLKSVKDPFDDASPVHTWTEQLSDAKMESELAGLFQGKLQRIEIIERGGSPRIVRARVVGSAAVEHGHRRHAARTARSCARPGRGSGTADGAGLSRRDTAAAGSRDRSRACRARRPRRRRTRAARLAQPLRSTVSSRSEIEQLSVLCSGPFGSAYTQATKLRGSEETRPRTRTPLPVSSNSHSVGSSSIRSSGCGRSRRAGAARRRGGASRCPPTASSAGRP